LAQALHLENILKINMEEHMKQKVLMLAVLLMCLVPILLLAQEEVIMQKGNKTIIIKGDDNLSKLDELKKMNIDVKMNMPGEDAPDAPFFGIYPADLDFPKAQALNYPNSYGILITGIVPNSPAYQYRLAEDDILMEMDGKKALNLKEFDKLKALYRAGDSVVLKIFRNGEIKDVNFTFGSRIKPQIDTPGETPKTKKLSVGDGGGSWIPLYFTSDLKDVNELVNAIGFSKLPEDGILTHGFGGKGGIGKGWFLGGQFQYYNDTKKINEVIETDLFTNSMSYDVFIGGATLDKRIAISNGVVTSLGIMIGGASHSIDLIHSNGDYGWPVATDANPFPNTQDVMGSNSNATISKGYILVQPRAEIMVRLLSWLGIRGEVGYIYGYGPHSGWKVTYSDGENYELKGSPDTPFEGMTFSVGPWFGF
jgi:hypothetical protein